MPECLVCYKETGSRCSLCLSPLCEDHLLPLSLHKQQCSNISRKRFTEVVTQKGLNDKASQAYQHLQNLHSEWEQAVVGSIQADNYSSKLDTLLHALYFSTALFGDSHLLSQDAITRLLLLLSDGHVDSAIVSKILDNLIEYPLKMSSKIRYLFNLLVLSSGHTMASLKVVSTDKYLRIRRNMNQAVFLLLSGERYSAQALLTTVLHTECSAIETAALRYVWYCAQTSSEGRRATLCLVTERDLEQSFPKLHDGRDVVAFFMQALLYFTRYNNQSDYSIQTIHDKMLVARSMLRDIMHMLQDVLTLNSLMLAALYVKVLAVLAETSSLSSFTYECGKEADRIYTQFFLSSRESSAPEHTIESHDGPHEQELAIDDLSTVTPPFRRMCHRLIFFPDDSSPPVLVTTIPGNPCVQVEQTFNMSKIITSVRALVSKRQKDRSITRRVTSSFADQRLLPLHCRSPATKVVSGLTVSMPIDSLQKSGTCRANFSGSSSKGVMEANLRVHDILADKKQLHKKRIKACNRLTNVTFISTDVDLDLLENRLYSSKIGDFIRKPGDQYIAALTKKVSSPYSEQSLCKFSKDLTRKKLTKDIDELINETVDAANTPVETGIVTGASCPDIKKPFSELTRTAIKDKSWEGVDSLLAETADVIGELNAYESNELRPDCAQV